MSEENHKVDNAELVKNANTQLNCCEGVKIYKSKHKFQLVYEVTRNETEDLTEFGISDQLDNRNINLVCYPCLR